MGKAFRAEDPRSDGWPGRRYSEVSCSSRADLSPRPGSPGRAARRRIAPATGSSGDRQTFTPSAADIAAGAIKISVTNGVAPDYSFRFRLYETGLSCPRWSVNSYVSLVDLQNTSDCAVNVSLILYRSDGSVASTTPVVLNANGATQISISAGMAGGVLFGSAAVFHNGAKGAITGGIYQVNNASAGANFLWPFTEIRSSGSTSGQ